jgi:hypothetical protein
VIQGPVSAATLPKCCVSQTELMQKQNGGLANPNFKDLARAIMRSQKVLQHPDMDGRIYWIILVSVSRRCLHLKCH